MVKQHRYKILTDWTGNLGPGTTNYRSYSRDHSLTAEGKVAEIAGSSDPAFRGDPSRYNPEELLVGALSSCHMLWVLHLCATAGIVVTSYRDEATGTMIETPDGAGQFDLVCLNPHMCITESGKIEEAIALHGKAHQMCFIARSVNFPVQCHAVVTA
jgi:organic hydroperoxide reductase OsmC/OhrA